MLRLILMRHAKSDWSHPLLTDHERPLNKRGKAAADALGDWLRRQGHIPDQVLCSSAERTGETLLRLDIAPAPRREFTKALYLAEAPAMMEVLRGATGTTVLMLGHNPGICEFAHRLVQEPPEHPRFCDYPTGATLVCQFDAPGWEGINWHDGQVVDFVTPHDLTS